MHAQALLARRSRLVRTVFPPCPQVIDRALEKVLVIEDDVRFEHQFKRRLVTLMEGVEQARLDWELM